MILKISDYHKDFIVTAKDVTRLDGISYKARFVSNGNWTYLDSEGYYWVPFRYPQERYPLEGLGAKRYMLVDSNSGETYEVSSIKNANE